MKRPSPARDRYFMKNALNISLRGIGNTWPNPSVGAVVVKNNQIIIKSNTVMKSYFNHKLTHGVFETFDKGEIKNNHLFSTT